MVIQNLKASIHRESDEHINGCLQGTGNIRSINVVCGSMCYRIYVVCDNIVFVIIF